MRMKRKRTIHKKKKEEEEKKKKKRKRKCEYSTKGTKISYEELLLHILRQKKKKKIQM